MAVKVELSSQKLFGFVLPAGLDAELIKQSVLAGLAAVFLLSIFLFLVLPRFTDLAAAQKMVSDLEKNVNSLNRALAVLDDFRDDVSLNTKESVYLAIPTRFDPGYILLALRQLALENRVNIISYSLGGGEVGKEEVTAGNLTNHQVRLEISGPPVNLIGFVDSLDSYLPVASVSELALSEVGKIFTSGGVESRLNLTLTYYHKPSPPVPAGFLLTNFLTPDEFSMITSLTAFKRLGTVTPSEGVPTSFGKENLFGI
ncbi:MAG: hypothetical protein AAB973_04310 [Patescibacteria group bacterium]